MLTHKGTQTIETERLILRRFRMEDAQAMYDRWACDPQVTHFLTWPPHADADVTRLVIKSWTAEYDKPDTYQWAITIKAQDELPVGCISVVRHDDAAQKAEIGYCIGRAWWRHGITSEALGAVIAFLFDEVGMERVEAKHDVNNPNSGRVMEKCGMIKEGIHRRADHNNQGIVDVCMYAILKDEWKSQSRENA